MTKNEVIDCAGDDQDVQMFLYSGIGSFHGGLGSTHVLGHKPGTKPSVRIQAITDSADS